MILGHRSQVAEGRRDIEELFRTALTKLGYQDAVFAWPKADLPRFDELVRAGTREDPGWTAEFLGWLRTRLRYPALVGAAAFVSERLVHGQHGMSRRVVDSVLQRADDPGHLLAHWSATYGPKIPKPVKRGVADAVTRLYDEDALRYDTDAHHFDIPKFLGREMTFGGGIRAPRPFRFGDVISLVHPVARDDRQNEVFQRALARQAAPQHSGEMSLPELVSSLRRLDRSGIPFETAMSIAARLTDPAEILASGLLPLRLYAAWHGVRTQRWRPVLETAARHSLAAIPEIPGRTLIIPGTREGVVFGLALAQRCAEVDVMTPAGELFEVIAGESPLHGLYRWPFGPAARPAAVGGGYDRVVIVEEELSDLSGVDGPVYAWQTAQPAWSSEQSVSYGLTDAAFSLIPLVERASAGMWPWSPRVVTNS
jgi:hypothetical protein